MSFDLEGRIVHWNRGAEHVIDVSAEEAIGLTVDELNRITGEPEGASARTADAFASAINGQTVRLEFQRRHQDGTLIDLEVTVTPWRVGGRVVGTTAMAVDVTKRKQAERELERLAQAAEYGADAIVSFDLDMRVRHWNSGAERLCGLRAEEVLGLTLEDLNALTGEPAETAIRARGVIARILCGEPGDQMEAQRRRKDGTVFDVLSTFVPWRVDGRVVGATNTTVDITERKRAERVREQALAELQQAQQVAKLGSWTWDPATEATTWSAQMFEIFGRHQADGPLTGEALLRHVHPEDRDRVASVQEHALAGVTSLELDYRIVVDGVQRALHMLAGPNPARPGGYLGTVQDVSEARQAECALRAAEERFRRAFEDAPTGMVLLSLDGCVEEANQAFSALCECDRAELDGARLATWLHPDYVGAADQLVHTLAVGGHRYASAELRIMPSAGSPVDVIVHASPLRYASGTPIRLLCQVQDITERKRFESQLQVMADHDPLTGLLNRRNFESELARHVQRIERYGADGALLVLDIDHFKAVNDTLGHSAGDQLIISIADALRDRLRASDVLARLGGDEFAVLLPKADPAEARWVAQELVSAVRDHTALLSGEQRAHVTTSVGVAMFEDQESLSGDAILVEADLAMYDAKEAGRDGYAFYAAGQRTSGTRVQLTWLSRIRAGPA